MNLAQACVEWRFRRRSNGMWRVTARVRCMTAEQAARASRVWSGRTASFSDAALAAVGAALGAPEEAVAALRLALGARPGRGRPTSQAHVLESGRLMAAFAERLRGAGLRVVGASALLAGPN